MKILPIHNIIRENHALFEFDFQLEILKLMHCFTIIRYMVVLRYVNNLPTQKSKLHTCPINETVIKVQLLNVAFYHMYKLIF